MPTSNAQRFLAADGDDRALALKMFWGVVLEAFYSTTLLWNAINGDGVGSDAVPSQVVSSKVITEGKSWQFPIIGEDPEAEHHTPGTELLGMQIEVDEGVITIDDILVAHADIPLDQTIVSHFEVVRPFAVKLGRSLATNFDKRLFITGVKAALTGGTTKNGMTIHNGGNVVSRDSTTLALAYPVSSTGAQNFIDDCAELAQLMDEDNVPEQGRFLALTPYIRRVLSKAPDKLFSSDFDAASQNRVNDRVIGKIEGFNVLRPTNHMPASDVSDKYAKYSGDFTASGDNGQPAALALCGADEGSAAIGYVSAGGVQPHMHFDERRNTTFLKAQMMAGAGVLAPWMAGAVRVRDET